MAVTIDSTGVGELRGDRSGGRRVAPLSAGVASARVARVGFALGALGLASCALVLLPLVESWRIQPRVAGHSVSVFGTRLSYPAANVWALLILGLALLGLLVTVMAVAGAVRELTATRRFVRELARRSPRELGPARVIEDARPIAFCAGLLRPRVSDAAIDLLDAEALEAVLAHELQHAQRRDPLRAAIGRALARALFFVPGLRELARRQRALAELSADEAAVAQDSSRRPALARAMLGFADFGGVGGEIDPARVDYLLGESSSWRFPSLPCLAAAAAIGLIAATAVLLGDVASGSATLAPPFLSKQPCVVVLALMPAILWSVAAWLHRALVARDA